MSKKEGFYWKCSCGAIVESIEQAMKHDSENPHMMRHNWSAEYGTYHIERKCFVEPEAREMVEKMVKGKSDGVCPSC